VKKSRRMRWVGHVAPVEEMKNACRIWSGNLTGRDHSEDLGVNGRLILEWILGKQDGKLLDSFIWLRIGNSGGLL
jgi:hypothetical protein